jgi:probable HAF family extracellular repeat protein
LDRRFDEQRGDGREIGLGTDASLNKPPTRRREETMNCASIRSSVALAATLLLAAVSLPASAQDAPAGLDFTFTRLPTLGGSYAGPGGINERGDVVGASTTIDGEYRAVLWRHGQVLDLGVGANSSASDINNNNAIIGSLGGRGFLWRDGVVQWLPSIEYVGGAPVAINDRGTIVGGDDTYAVVWTKDTETKLGAPGLVDWASGINEKGEAVGCASDRSNPATAAMLFTRAGSVMLPGAFAGIDAQACPSGINNRHQIVGACSQDFYSPSHATRWDDQVPVLLPDAGFGSSAYAINDGGWTVGSTSDDGATVTAALWVGNRLVHLDKFIDPRLKADGWALVAASAINNRGWIAGAMQKQVTGETAAFLLVPR